MVEVYRRNSPLRPANCLVRSSPRCPVYFMCRPTLIALHFIRDAINVHVITVFSKCLDGTIMKRLPRVRLARDEIWNLQIHLSNICRRAMKPGTSETLSRIVYEVSRTEGHVVFSPTSKKKMEDSMSSSLSGKCEFPVPCIP